MKKTSILLLSILVASLAVMPSQSTFAAIEEKGTTWWSVAEMLEFYQEVEVEKTTECGDDYNCRMEFDLNLRERGPKYSALANFVEGQIWITSVNPSEETVKVLFFDEDMMLKHMGIEEKLTLKHLYIGWFEDWQGQIYNYDHKRFTNGSIEGLHAVYDSYEDDISRITPWREVELSASGSELLNNTSGKLGIASYADMFNAQGMVDYSNCLNMEEYQEGVECKMYVSSDQWVSFFPPIQASLTAPEENYAGNETLTDDEPGQEAYVPEEVSDPNEMIQPITEDEIDNESNNMVDNTVNEKELIIEENDSIKEYSPLVYSGVTIKAPETGTLTTENQTTTEFPWWLGAIIGLNVVTLLWLFCPDYPKNTKKIEKKSKTGLTKKVNCDKMVSV